MIVSVSNLRCRRVADAVNMKRKKHSFGGFRCFCVAALFAAAAFACGRAKAEPSISIPSIAISGVGYDIGLLNAATGALYVSIPGSGLLYWRNRETGNSADISVDGGTGTPYDVAVYNDAVNPRVFMTGQSSQEIYVYNVATGAMAPTISLAGFPNSVAVNNSTGLVYVTMRDSDLIKVYNAVTYALVTTISGNGLDGPAGIRVNETTDKLYVCSSLNDKIYVYNATAYTYIKTINVYDNPTRIAIDEEKNLIYALHGAMGGLSVIDGSIDDSIGSISIGVAISDVMFHPEVRNIYVSATGSKKVYVYNGVTREAVTGSPLILAAGPKRLAALTPADNPQGPYDTATVNDTATLTVIEDSDTYPPVFDGVTDGADAENPATATVYLTWGDAEDINKPIAYNVFAALEPATSAFDWDSPIYTTGATGTFAIQHATITYGTQYYFAVRAMDNAPPPNQDENTAFFPVKPTDGAPPVGGELISAVNTMQGGEITLDWSAATDNSPPITFDIFQSQASLVYNWSSPATSVQGVTTKTMTGLSNGTTYYYVVRARDVAGLASTNTVEYSATPTDGVPPTFAGIQNAADDSTGGTVVLLWNQATDKSLPITYYIYYNLGGSITSYATAQLTLQTVTGTTITGLTNNVNYTFAVRAHDSAGNAESNMAAITTMPTDTIDPTYNGITACTDTGTGSSLTLGWSAASDKSHPITYSIYKATTYGTDQFNFASWDYQATETTLTTAGGLTMGQEYFFVALAEDAAGNVGGSQEEIYPIDPNDPYYVPCIPTDGADPVFAGITAATATGNTGEILLTWNEATDSSHPINYNIYQATHTITVYTDWDHQVAEATSTTIIGLDDGTTYYFAVRAEDAGKRTDHNTVQKTAIPNDGTPPVFAGIGSLVDAGTSKTLNAAWAAAADPATPITYKVFVSMTPGGQNFSSPNTSTTGTNIVITGLVNGTNYFVVVRAVDAGGVTETNTVELSASPSDITPPTFAGLSSAADTGMGGEVRLDWTPGADPSTPISYMIYMATGAAVISYATASYTAYTRPHSVTGLQNGTLHKFAVRARDSYGNTDGNVIVRTVTPTDTHPPTFAGIASAVDAQTYGAINISWSAASDPSTPITYKIYYHTSNNYGTILAAGVRATTTLMTYQMTGATNGVYTYFIVRAQDGYGNTDTNTTVRGAVPSDRTPPVFAGLESVSDSGLGGEVSLSWSAASDPSTPITYKIYYSTSTGTLYSAVRYSTAGLSYTISGLTNGTPYYFAVRAKDASTAADNTDTNTVVITRTPTDITPPTWTGLQTAQDAQKGGEIVLNWSAATDRSTPVYYNVYLSTASGGQEFSTTPYTVTASTSYHIAGLTDGVSYYAVATARDSSANANETSTASLELTVTPTDSTPPAFAGLQSVTTYSENGVVRLQWNAAADRTPPITYNIYRASMPGGYGGYASPTYTCATTSYLVSGLNHNQLVFFVVRAKDSAAGPNTDTNTVEKNIRFFDTIAPNPPAGVTAVAGDESGTAGDEYVTISWSAPEANEDGSPLVDLAGYNLYRGTISGSYGATPINKQDGVLNALIPAASSTYKDQFQLIEGQTYYYVIRSVDDASNESNLLSDEVTATPLNADDAIPTPPYDVSASAGDGYVDIHWTKPIYNEDGSPLRDLQGYYIYRGTTSGNYGLLSPSVIPPNTLQYHDTNVTNETTYYYVLKALDSSTPPNDSDFSEEVSAKPGIAIDYPPSAPTNLSAISGNGTAYLTWSAPTTNSNGSPISGDRAGYNIYRSVACLATGTTKLNTLLLANPSYSDSGLSNGLQYSYHVTAVDYAEQESASSTPAIAIYGTKGVMGTLLYRDKDQPAGPDGYPKVGVSCLTVHLTDTNNTVLSTGYTSTDGSFKIVYQTPSPTAKYRLRLVVIQGSGFPYNGAMIDGIAYLTLKDRFNLSADGFTVLSTPTIGIGPAVGDGNCDGVLNISDISVLKKSFGKSAGQTGYDIDADFNGDGVVSISDVGVLKANFGVSVDVITPSPCATP